MGEEELHDLSENRWQSLASIMAADRLRLLMLIAGGGPSAHDGSALLLEARSELVHGVAEVVRVARLVPHAKDRHLLSRQIKRGQVAVEELVPRGAAALGVGPSVPRRRSNDEAVARLTYRIWSRRATLRLDLIELDAA